MLVAIHRYINGRFNELPCLPMAILLCLLVASCASDSAVKSITYGQADFSYVPIYIYELYGDGGRFHRQHIQIDGYLILKSDREFFLYPSYEAYRDRQHMSAFYVKLSDDLSLQIFGSNVERCLHRMNVMLNGIYIHEDASNFYFGSELSDIRKVGILTEVSWIRGFSESASGCSSR